MTRPIDHPQRYALVNELHARPFPALRAPGHAVYLAIKEPVKAHNRDRARDMAHLSDLLGRSCTPPPDPLATHFSGALGRGEVKWESHTEFVTYSAFLPGLPARPFDAAEAQVFPADWVAAAPGKVVSAILIRVEPLPEVEAEMLTRFEEWFVPESLAVARVVDGAAVVAGDFRIDASGHMRFAVFVRPDTGSRRVGRILQRLCEIETYRAMSMLGLTRARELTGRLNALDPRLSELVTGLESGAGAPEAALHELLTISAELESLAVRHSFRFGATRAYEAIVHQRIGALREEAIGGRQSFAEFMMRRYDPAMRTVKSAESRLAAMADRAGRAAELLRTRVEVTRLAENHKLLESMDRRADLALRLQHTVEGLSVVAISYYAVSLGGYVLAPLAERAGIGKPEMLALLTPVVMVMVWGALSGLRRRLC